MRGVRWRSVAVLRGVQSEHRRARPSAMRAVRGARRACRSLVPSLPAGPDRRRAGAVLVRRSRAPRGAPAEIRGVAASRRGARRRDGRIARHPGGRRHVGSALARPQGLSRVRSGARACRRGRADGRSRGRAAASPSRRGRSASATGRRRAPERDARLVCGAREASVARRSRRRRSDDRRDRCGVRGHARSRRRVAGLRADGGASGVGQCRGWIAPILGSGLASGSVVARGTSPR
jgi:hypothetical protein